MPKDDYEKRDKQNPKYTGPSIPTDGDHIHALLGEDYDYTYINPGSFEIGAGRGRVKVRKHVRGWPGFPEYGVDVKKHTRSYPDIGLLEIGNDNFWDGDPRSFHEIGQSTFYEIGCDTVGAFSKSFDLNPPRLTGKVNYYEKKGKLITCAEVYIPASDTNMIVSIKTPIKPIMKMLAKGASPAMLGLEESDFYEIGWYNPFNKIKKGVKHLKKTSKRVAKKLSKKVVNQIVQSEAFKKATKKISALSASAKRKAMSVVENPHFRQFAQVAAVSTAMYFGVPPSVTIAATGVLFAAMNGDPASLEKVQEVAELAAEGYEPAQKMKAVMTTVYKGGMEDMKPYLEKAQEIASTNFIDKSKAIAEQALPTEFRLPSKAPGGMFPFNIPSFDYGPPISGWLYNVPYRSNLQAKSLDIFGKGRNPFHLLRGAYKQGMTQ